MKNKIDELNNLIKVSKYAHKEMNREEAYENSREAIWQNKVVEKKKVIFDGKSLDNVEIKGACTYSLKKEGLSVIADTKIENMVPRPTVSIRINFDDLDLSEYTRVNLNIYIKAVGHQNFYYHLSLGNPGSHWFHAPSIEPNKDNHIIWEFGDIKHDNVKVMTIQPFLMGSPDEALSQIEIIIKSVSVEKVKEDYIEGWALDERIAHSHVGYFINKEKVALTGIAKNEFFEILDINGNSIYKKEVIKLYTDLGQYFKLDFSDLRKKGSYAIKIDERITPYFLIDNRCYESSIWKSMNFLRSLRCGEEVQGVHSACHLTCKTINKDGVTVPNFGGWHDAGDLSQFEIPTAEMAQAVLELAVKYKDKNNDLYERLLEEGKVGLTWLLRTRFGNGERALAVSYGVWRTNVLQPDNKSVEISKAEEGPFENSLASAAEAIGYKAFKGIDDIFAEYCLRSAVEDFDFAVDELDKDIYTKRWGPSIESQVCGCLTSNAAELYEITGEEKYLSLAKNYAKRTMACQETTYLDLNRKIRGYFYEDKEHSKMLMYEHRGHEQNPIQGIARLCEVAPNDEDYKKWIKCLKLYKEYVEETMFATYPYELIPGHVYDINKINIDRITVPTWYYKTPIEAMPELKEQTMAGIKLSETMYLRRFPIAIQRRGYHATLLSKTKAVSMIAKVLNDKKLKQIAIKQLEWILGNNPFAVSTMYGEGHDYHPLYVAFSRQMVGALPVGIMTNGNNDSPFWPTYDNAVYKEVWGHTTGKYLWVLADLID